MPDPAPTEAAPLLAKVLDPAAPRPLRLAAARGALPLARQELVLALVRLGSDADTEISGEAGKSLAGLPVEVLESILSEPRADPSVLGHFARKQDAGTVLLAAIVTNPSASDEIILHLAGGSDAAVLALIVGNETRLARNNAIVRTLKANPVLPRESRRRITELEEHVLGHEEISFHPAAAPEAPVPRGAEGVPIPPVPEEEGEAPAPVLEVPLTPEEQAAEEALQRTPLYQRIVRMNIAEKIQAAIKGNAEERAILIRDPSRLVASTVLKSPKVNEQEIENYAKLRNVNDEVLRIIGTHRGWTKAYNVALALTRNPRTPTGVSLTMLSRLVNKDLKNLGIDKNIPEVIRRSAKRLFELHTKPAEKGKRK
jgi:hypothetical protein